MELKHKKHFLPGNTVYATISSTSNPNLLIPVKAEIIGTDHHIYNPKYIIKIIKFYDNLSFIKKNFLKKNFRYGQTSSKSDTEIKTRVSHNKAGQYNIENITELEMLLSGTIETGIKESKQYKFKYIDFIDYKERHYVVVDSYFVFEFKYEMLDLVNNLTDFLIYKHIRELETYVVRNNYNGEFKIKTRNLFYNRLRNFFADIKIDRWKRVKNLFLNK